MVNLLRLMRTSANKSVLSTLSPYMLPQFEQVAFVDRENGSNAQDGTDWDHAVKDFNHAIDLFWGGSDTKARGRHYAILYRCRTTSGQKFTEEQIIDMEGIHLYGMGAFYGLGGGHDSCFVLGPSTSYTDKCGIKFTKSGCSVEGIKFYMPSENALGSEEYCIYGTNNIGMAIRNCQFIGANADGDMTGRYLGGILFEGAESPIIEDNQFLYTYRGVKGMAGTSRYFHKGVIRNNHFYSNDIAIYLGDSYGVENEISHNTILQKVNYGYTITAGIKLNGCSANYLHDNRVGHGTKTTAYTKGAGTNYWSENYLDGSGSTLYDGS